LNIESAEEAIDDFFWPFEAKFPRKSVLPKRELQILGTGSRTAEQPAPQLRCFMKRENWRKAEVEHNVGPCSLWTLISSTAN
jgi:hypothetical protein